MLSIADKLSTLVDIHGALRTYAGCVCRAGMEDFGRRFIKLHTARKKHCPGICQRDLDPYLDTTTSILSHFETCPIASKAKDNLFGGNWTVRFNDAGIRKQSRGSFSELFEALYAEIHKNTLLRDKYGSVIVPSDLPVVQKRFWIRYLVATGEAIKVFDGADLREPLKDEIESLVIRASKKRKIRE